MADREAFEAWLRKRWAGDRDALTIREDGEYWNGQVQFAFAAWQAAVAQTARECAEICEQQKLKKQIDGEGDTYYVPSRPSDCAQAIRERFGIKE